jgi:hypothetical protein
MPPNILEDMHCKEIPSTSIKNVLEKNSILSINPHLPTPPRTISFCQNRFMSQVILHRYARSSIVTHPSGYKPIQS